MIDINERSSEMTGRNLIPLWRGKIMLFSRIGFDRIEQSFFKTHL